MRKLDFFTGSEMEALTTALTPPGMPDWVGLVVLVLGALVVLAYAVMPFSVFGTKSRLESIEAQLDELQTELRSLSLRMREPAPMRGTLAESWIDPPPSAPRPDQGTTPPIPPPPAFAPPASAPPDRGRRTEPRLDWPEGR
jgi:hypothetical protein